MDEIIIDEVHDIWNKNAAFWDEHMGEGNDFHRLLIEPGQIELLEIKPGDSILDIACGNGQFARKMAGLGAPITTACGNSKWVPCRSAWTIGREDNVSARVKYTQWGSAPMPVKADRQERVPWTSYTYHAPTPRHPTHGVLVKATYPGPVMTDHALAPTRASLLRQVILSLQEQGQARYEPGPYGFSAIVNPRRKQALRS